MRSVKDNLQKFCALKFLRSQILDFEISKNSVFANRNLRDSRRCPHPRRRQRKPHQTFARRCARHVGDTHGDTLGDTVSPSCIPQLACKFPCKYKALADRSATRINRDLPLGAPPLGLPISPSVPDSISASSLFPLRSRHTWLSASWMLSLHWGHC